MMAQVLGERSVSNRAVWRLVLWGALTLVPLTGYATPLLNAALADTPIADMIWIPILGVVWGAWELTRRKVPRGDPEVSAMAGFLLAGSAGLLLVAGMTLWPYSFVGNSDALLLWPVWGMAMAWMLFGTGATRILLFPMAYLGLAWPPILTWFASLTQGLLVRVAVVEVNVFAGLVNWVRSIQPAGTFLVQHGAQTIPVQVSNACSGADSVIAVLIVLPLILTQLRGPLIRKMVLIAGAIVVANMLNLLRLIAIVGAAHYTGLWFAFDIVHPSLGFVLFAALVVLVFPAAGWLGLATDLPASTEVSVPSVGWARAGLSTAMAGTVFVLVLPIGAYAAGAPGRPFTAKTDNLATLMGSIPGFERHLLGRFNDSEILGLGAISYAYGYAAPSGAYVQAEIWQTPNLNVLEAYTFHNCLLFHGSRILSQRSFMLATGEYATAYRVQLPPTAPGGARYSYEDVEWTTALRFEGKVRYLRVAVAAIPSSAGAWRGLYRPIHVVAPQGVEAMAAPPNFGKWPQTAGDTLPAIEALARSFSAQLKARATAG